MNNSSERLLAQAKQRLPLSTLMTRLGLGEHARKSARCPFHDDASASFSVYQGDDGQERWKCFAGCGEGDAIDFLARHRNLSNADACREFVRLAGVSAPTMAPRPNTVRAEPGAAFNWPACVAAFTAEHRRKLADWRGYTPEFVDWLQAQGLVGLFEGERIAFPVHNAEGEVVGCHYRLKEDGTWRYHPNGTRTTPLVIGDLRTASAIYIFESQWDLLALLDTLRHHREPLMNVAAIATRGASNGRLPASLCDPNATIHAFAQNDPAGQKWLQTVVAQSGCKALQVATPLPHKDLNDWTRAGATADDIRRAIADARQVPIPATPDFHAAPPHGGADRRLTLSDEEEGDDGDTPRPFPVEALPPELAAISAAVAQCERVPVALPAVCALGTASAAIGAGLEVVSGSDRVTRANLFLLAAAESGSGKSQAFRRISQPVVEYQLRLYETFREQTAPRIGSELGLSQREIKRLEGKAAKTNDPAERERLLGEIEAKRARIGLLERENSPPCIVCADVTSEKLAVLLACNREILFSASSEARQIVDIVCGRYNATKSTDVAVYLSGYSGDFLRVDRLGRDPLTLHRPCLSVLWLLQPDALSRLFGTDSLAQSGFLPRFLICHTQAVPVKIEETEAPTISEALITRWSDVVGRLLTTYHSAGEPFRIEPTPEAKRLLDSFFNQIVDRRGLDLRDVGAFASRYAEQAWRVALTFHASTYIDDAHNQRLEAATVTKAITVVEWFIEEQLRVLSRGRREAAESLEDQVFELMERNRARKERDFTTARDVCRKRIVPTPEAAKALLSRMEADGLLVGQDITPAGGGKTTRIYRAVGNPIPA